MTLLTKAGEPPSGYVKCITPDCMSYIWRPETKRPRCSDCAKADELARAVQRDGAAGARRVLRGR